MARPPGGRPKRQTVKRKPKVTFRVFAEGSLTEPSYFNHLGRTLSGAAITFADCNKTDPISIVKAAKAEKKGHGRNGPYDEYWCLFDRDEDFGYGDAIVHARDAGINVGYSNPCFELWLLLHSTDISSFVSHHEAQAKCQSLGLVNGKDLCAENWARLADELDAAMQRAIDLRQRNLDIDVLEHENPSTSVDELVRRLLAT